MKLFSFGLPLLALASAEITRENFKKELGAIQKYYKDNVNNIEDLDAYKRLKEAGRPIAEGNDAIRRREAILENRSEAEAKATPAQRDAMKAIWKNQQVASGSDDAVLQEYQRNADEFDVLLAKSYLKHKATFDGEVTKLKEAFDKINNWRVYSVQMTEDELNALAVEIDTLDLAMPLIAFKNALMKIEFPVGTGKAPWSYKRVTLREYKPVAVLPSTVVQSFKQKVTSAVGVHEDRKAHGDLLHEVHDKIHAADVSQESLKEIVAKLVEAEVHEELAELKEELMQIEITLKDAEGKETKTNLAKIAASSVKKMSPGVIAAIVVVAVLVVGGAGAFLYFQRKP